MPAAFKTALGSSSPNIASSSSFTITTSAAIAVGDLVVVRVAADNLSATTPTFTCADSGGNTYTTHRQAAANATAAAGVAGAIMCSKATVAVASGGTITITLSGAVVAKAAYAESFTGVDNTVRSTPVSATAASGTALASPASGTVNAGDLVLGCGAIKSRGGVVGDADTTNGSWSARELVLASASGTDTARVEVSGQYKIATASGAQTFNQTVTSTDWVAILVVLQAVPDPAVTQASYRFYDQGTESGSVALGAQDTAINGDLSFGDGIGHLRVRLQLSAVAATPATDDWTLQYEKNTSGTWLNAYSEALLDSYDVANENGNIGLGMVTGGSVTDAQAFLGNGQKLKKVRFRLNKNGTPTGNLSAVLLTHSGTFGSGAPTGTPLTTSTTVLSIATLTTTMGWYEFTFDGTYTLANGTAYFIGLATTQTQNDSNYVRMGADTTSPTHAGNLQMQLSGGSWVAASTTDLIFELYTSSATGGDIDVYNDPNLTDGAATTNRLGAGSGSFVAGKVSETGVVTDLGWAASNYTEVLYSVTIKKPSFADGDTIRFRVVRNGATTGMTYTQTPLINVVSTDNAATIATIWNPVAVGTLTPTIFGATTTLNKPTGLANGNAVCISCTGDASAAFTGFTRVDAPPTGASMSTHSYLFYKNNVTAASEPATYSTSAGSVFGVVTFGVRDQDPTTFLDVAAATANDVDPNNANIISGSVSPISTNCLLLFGAAMWVTTTTVSSTPAGMSLVGFNTATGDNHVVWSQALTAAGATGTRTAVMGNNTEDASYLAAVRGAAGGSGDAWTATAVGTVSTPAGTNWPATIATTWAAWTATAVGTVASGPVNVAGTIATTWVGWTATGISTVNHPATINTNWSPTTSAVTPDFLETFTQSDGNLALGWTTPGGTGNAVKVVNGRIDNSGVGASSDAYKAAHGVNVSGDVEINFDFVLNGGTGSIGVRVALLNMGTGNGNGVLISGDGAGGGVVHVQRWTSGATVGYFTNYPHGIADFNTHHARVTYTAATGQWDIWIDGVGLGSGNDSSTQPNGPGVLLNFNGASSCKMDNLAINSYIGSPPPTVVATTNNGGNVTTVNKPAGGAVGDHYVLHVVDQDRTSSDPGLAVTGFVSTGPAQGVNGTGGYWWEQTFIRAHDGSEGSTFAPSNLGGIWCYLTCHLVRGANPATLSLGAQGALSGAGNLVVPGVTPAAATALALIHATDYDGGTTVYTDPAGWTQITKGTFSAAWAWRKNVLAAATGNVTIARTSATRAAGQMLALPPAAVAAGTGWTATAIGTAASGPVNVAGTIATTWTGWTATGVALTNHVATIATSWGTWTATAVTNPDHPALGVSTWSAWTATAIGTTASGAVNVAGTIATTWAAWTATGVALTDRPATGASTWSTWTATAIATPGRTATIATSWGTWTATAVTNPDHKATIATTWTAWTATAVGKLDYKATIATTWTAWTATAVATVNRPATISTTWSAWSATATATTQHVATISTNWGTWDATALGAVPGQASGTIDTNWGTWTATASALANHKATIDSWWSSPILRGTVITSGYLLFLSPVPGDGWITTDTGHLWTFQGPPPSDNIVKWTDTGVFNAWTATAVTVINRKAVAATTWTAWTATATSTVNRPATAATSWGTWTATAIGLQVGQIPGTIATNWGTWTAAGVASIKHDATIVTSWGTWTGTGVGVSAPPATNWPGTITTTWGPWTATSFGTAGPPGVILNDAVALYIGDLEASAAYVGAVQVWPHG